jgi:hypothetical protein
MLTKTELKYEIKRLILFNPTMSPAKLRVQLLCQFDERVSILLLCSIRASFLDDLKVLNDAGLLNPGDLACRRAPRRFPSTAKKKPWKPWWFSG